MEACDVVAERGKFSLPQWQARQCYMKHSTEFKMIPTSAASPLLLNKCTVIAASILPVMNPDGKVLFACSLCSVMPPGLVPAVLEATYPAMRKLNASGDQCELLCAGHREVLLSLAAGLRLAGNDPGDVQSLTAKLESIRTSMGREMGEDHADVQRIVEKRASEAISVMETLARMAQPRAGGLGEALPGLNQPNLDAFSFP